MGGLFATLVLTLLGAINIISFSEAGNDAISLKSRKVFERGTLTPVRVDASKSKPPKPLVIVSPNEEGVYPILLFIHGSAIPNHEYTQLFYFIASHGIIVVAPMLFRQAGIIPLLPSHQEEIDAAANVANWLAANLNTAELGILPELVTANFNRFAVSGHSRGGKSAFALVLGFTKKTTLNVKVSALLGVDPVAGNNFGQTKPYILTNKPNSIHTSTPTTIIGTGVGRVCTPRGLNHAQFYKEYAEASHFVVANYGHADMLNDGNALTRAMCGSGRRGTYDVMRRTVGGIMVAFLDAFLRARPEAYYEILSNPSLAPATLHPVEAKGRSQLYSDA